MLNLWYAALRASIGIAIEVSDMDRAKQLLYIARAESADPALQGISVLTAPGVANQLWLVRKDRL